MKVAKLRYMFQLYLHFYIQQWSLSLSRLSPSHLYNGLFKPTSWNCSSLLKCVMHTRDLGVIENKSQDCHNDSLGEHLTFEHLWHTFISCLIWRQPRFWKYFYVVFEDFLNLSFFWKFHNRGNFVKLVLPMVFCFNIYLHDGSGNVIFFCTVFLSYSLRKGKIFKYNLSLTL